MALACIDSHVLIWAIQEAATPGQELMIPRAKSLLRWLEKTDTKVLVPSVVEAEFLLAVPPEMHATVNNLLSRSFLVAPFDAQAAVQYSRIYQAKKDMAVIRELLRDGKTRQALKADMMIIATAVARGADSIYSHDPGVRRFGEGCIDVRAIPEILEQGQLL